MTFPTGSSISTATPIPASTALSLSAFPWPRPPSRPAGSGRTGNRRKTWQRQSPTCHRLLCCRPVLEQSDTQSVLLSSCFCPFSISRQLVERGAGEFSFSFSKSWLENFSLSTVSLENKIVQSITENSLPSTSLFTKYLSDSGLQSNKSAKTPFGWKNYVFLKCTVRQWRNKASQSHS
jgi:hypothetical protein